MRNSNTGKYIFDRETGKVVKVSSDIPKTKKQNSGGCPHAHVCGGSCGH